MHGSPHGRGRGDAIQDRRARRPLAAVAAGLALWLAAAPAEAATLYGLVDTGEIFSSADGGAVWSPLATLPVRDAAALAARLSSADLFLVGRSGSVYRSTTSGASWTPVGTIAAGDVVDLAIRPDGTLLVLTASGSLFASADLGASFTALAALTGSDFVSLGFATPAAAYYALTRSGSVYESADGGASWTPKGALAVPDAARIRAVQSSLYVLTGTGDVFRSNDLAVSWTPIGTLSQVGMVGLVRNGDDLAAASREGHLATSPDGVSWTWLGSINQLALTALASNEPATTGVDLGAPGAARLLGAPYPNPGADVLAFRVDLPRDTEVTLDLFDVGGRLVARRGP
ncbi:MAG: WD40/YVTN/BNR-like repeat-containing protein, partial [Candidatus Eiseniibacteriota bacterium]